MAGIDAGEGAAAPPPPEVSPRQRIEQKLILHGVPHELMQEHQEGLLLYMEAHKEEISDMVKLILSVGTEKLESRKPSKKDASSSSSGDAYSESLSWLQWLMFNHEPEAMLEHLEHSSQGERAVCGSVWGQNDLAYRCRTCENDPTCAICVPCFQNGDHKDHDYSIMYTGGGCCDCGDATAWKREGFCSKHKGAEQIKPLPEELVSSVGPVLDVLLQVWKERICMVEPPPRTKGDSASSCKRVAEELTTSVSSMLLEFCTCSESLLSFLSLRIRECPDLLDTLTRAEKLLDKKVVKKLHELLLKLISDPAFKYEFAKVFIRYYPVIFGEVIKACNDSLLEEFPLMPTFSVQIFTVPTLTPRLVREVDLLGVLFDCLTDLFRSCISEDARLQTNKWGNLFDVSVRLLEDTRYVLSHEEVSKYVAYEKPDLIRSWIKLLSLVQGMDPQKRVTSIHAEDENEHLSAPFVLGHYLGVVQNLLMKGAFSPPDQHESTDVTVCSTAIKGMESAENQRNAKVGRVSQQSSISISSSRDSSLSCRVPPSAAWLILQCLRAIESWLEPELALSSKLSSLDASSSGPCNFVAFLEERLTSDKGGPSTKMDAVGVKINEGSQSDYHEAFSSVQEHGSMMHVDQDLMAQASKETGKGKMSESSNATDLRLHPDNAISYTLTDGSLLYAHPDSGIEELGILNARGWPHVVFDVSSQETSFHIPLHRMLSSLLRKALKKCFGEYAKPDEGSNESDEFFSVVLKGCQPYGFASIVMEHPLRVRVFCAQIRAGMWRKNGDAAILSAEWYRSVQWLEQGLESDLFLLQCCAALSSPEFFVRTIQERFGLSSYTSLDLSEQNEYESVLMQEMLTFIIQLVKERRFCGLSTVDNLKRELIYKLAIGDATHSQIVKSLPRDLSSSDELQNVLDSLAVYSNPSGMKQGKYVLRKTCWKDLDLYHPRWNSRELQFAEERYYRFCKISALNAQLPQWTRVFSPLRNISKVATSKAILQIVRAVLFYALYSDATSASRAPDNVLVTGLHLLWLALDICESESQIYASQSGMDIVQHDDESWVVLSSHIEETFPILTYSTELVAPESGKTKKESILTLLVSLMKKYKEENDITFSGSKYCNIPSLIESLLKKFAKLSKECMLTLRQMAPDVVPSTTDQTSSKDSPEFSADSLEKKVKARQRQAEIMARMRAEQSKFAETMKSSVNEGHDVLMSEPDVSSSTGAVSEESLQVCSLCRESDSKSPLCYLILLQKSRLASFVDMGNPSWENQTQANKSSGSFKREDSTDSSVSDSSTSSEELVHDTTVEPSFELDSMEVDDFIDLSNEQRPLNRYVPSFPSGHCNNNADDVVSLEDFEADIYKSIVKNVFGSNNVPIQDAEQTLSPSTSDVAVDFKKIRSPKCSILGTYVSCISAKHRQSALYDVASRSSASVTRNKFSPTDCDGIHISSCGHAVHQECHDRYLFSLKQRYIRRLGFEGGHIVDPDLGELLCPVCRRFSNSILPASPTFSTLSLAKPFVQTMSAEDVTTTSDMDINNLQFPRALSLLQNAGKVVEKSNFLRTLSGRLNQTTEPSLDPSLRRLTMLYYPRNHSSFSASERLSPSLFLWDTLKYSLVSTEIASRGRMSSHASESKSCLESLRSELNSSSGFILSLLLRVAHSARNLNHLEVLLRFEGIQLLAGSICSCVSGYKDILNAIKRKGSLPPLVDQSSEGELFPDIQFWKQCADPVLAQDPFSSLMSALFCLPVQFVSSSEFFVPFVHLFYVVCVIQALITCYGEETFDRSSFNDCLLNDVCKTMSGYDIAREYFVSKYINPSCHPKDMVRRLTFPYLRRCALLWELLRSSSASPLYDSSNIWEGSHLYLSNSTQDGDTSLAVELNGIRELEDLFQIQSLDLILRDESVHMLALKWSQHFYEEYSSRKYKGALFSTPAVPFRLMQLPPVYQVLLERYVKMQCPDCGSVPDEPALCLLCGKLCSPSWKPCCRTGKCLNHALQCGAGVGIFLLVRKTTILLQRSARLAFWPSPYLDAFGEEDHEMQRGKPLYLSPERYAALTYLVASHSLDRTSEVLRQTTISFYGD